MKHDRLDGMVKGWFVGDFAPSALRSQACEVSIKVCEAGYHEPVHFHLISTEVTVILSGRALMNGQEWGDGDIITIEPNEPTDFTALTDVVTVVVKTPSAPNDKYVVSDVV